MDEKTPVTPSTPSTLELKEDAMGLTDVNPSLANETPLKALKDGYFPSLSSPSPPPSHAHTSTLGLGNHGPAYYRTVLFIPI